MADSNKLNIYVPKEILDRMSHYNINWSKVAQEAFIKHMAELDNSSTEYGPYVSHTPPSRR
jgi:post-segregation antitoxin (ccd killing protein)